MLTPLRRILPVVAAVLAVGLIIAVLPRYHAALTTTVPWDLVPDQRMARAFISGFNPYSTEGMARTGLEGMGPVGAGHPPTTALWALPFAQQDLRTAAVTLGASMAALVFGMLLLLARVLGARTPVLLAWLAFAYVLSCPFMTYHIGVGQFSAAIAALYTLAWWAARRRRDGLAGVALGAACTIKLFPGVMVLFFLLQGRWRAVLAAAATYLTFAAVATTRFGWAAWPEFFSRQGIIAGLSVDSIQNQSLHGIVLRLFHPACGPHGSPLPASTAISVALSVALIGVGAVWARRAVGGSRFDLSYALFVTLSVLTSQWAWEHYDVIYLLPVAVALRTLVDRWHAPQRRGVSGGIAVLALLAISWQLDAGKRLALQAAVRAGQERLHVWMHLHEILNWAPPVALMILIGGWLAASMRGADQPI